ncbi:MAG: NADH:ubiquinone reductase (Na(+)-transporting) subunit C [Flavobacteriaceae bacterium]|nr:NADH:ubiquinone reductase (Na(+)-transporting) subunit C [Flavobacteriaceae bacterium]
MDRDSNSYTFLFSAIMVIVVASTLAFTASVLKEKQNENVRKEKMQNILSTIGVLTDRDGAEKLYKIHIIEEITLKKDGKTDDKIKAFSIDLKKEIRKPVEMQRFPLYVASVKEFKYYIFPLRGSGLWDAIWGYLALEEDMKTIKGVVFDHKGETAGLGAEITQEWFQDSFKGEKIIDVNGSLVGISVSKVNNDPKGLDKQDHEVDAISGATITGDGLSDMIYERLSNYMIYLKNNKLNKKQNLEIDSIMISLN